MVQAILAGTKTQTRRVVKPQPVFIGHPGTPFKTPDADPSGIIHCPYGVPGVRLNVKENAWCWCEKRSDGLTKTGRNKHRYIIDPTVKIHYQADLHVKPPPFADAGHGWGWRLKIGRYLPRELCRITLEVTGIRCERLQAISEADAKAEGVSNLPRKLASHRELYWELWNSINGPGSWDANPWVWVVEFKRIKP
jgi:hypothetical protein